MSTKETKPNSKDQYGPPLPSPSNTKPTEQAQPSGSKTITSSSTILLRPSQPTLANIIKNQADNKQKAPLSTSNRFTPLTYYNTLIGPKDFLNPSPLIPSSSSLALSQPTYQPQDEYLTKPEIIPILILEKQWIKTSTNPTQIAANIFPSNIHYLSSHPEKTRTFYEFILIDTESIELTHQKDDQGKITFSKIKILKIMRSEEWGQPPHVYRSFSRYFSPQQYNYFDYIDAWTHILLLRPMDHSWFIWFRRGIPLQFPKWFIKWFVDYGPLPSIFPTKVMDLYNYFREKSTFVTGFRLVSFIASQAISWIITWEYTLYQPYDKVEIQGLGRTIKIKWWKKFNLDLLSKNRLDEWFRSTQNKTSTSTSLLSKDSTFLSEKQKLMAELAAATSFEEFNKTFEKVKSLSEDNSSTAESDDHPFFRNEDMFD